MLYPRSTHARGGKGASSGNRATAQGTRTDSPGANCSGAFLVSWYNRNDDEMVWVIQYNVTFASNSSFMKRVSTSPPQSDQLRNFSMIQAANPAGESFERIGRCLRFVALQMRVGAMLSIPTI